MVNFSGFWHGLSDTYRADIRHGLGNAYSIKGREPESFDELIQVKDLLLFQGDLSPLRHFPGLQTLSVPGQTVDSYMPLATLANLKKLELANCNLENLDFLEGMPALKDLNISRTAVVNLEPLSKLPSLNKLNISHTSVADPEPLILCRKLKDLNISNCPGITALPALKNLTALNIQGSGVKDISFTAELKKLKYIGLTAPLEGLETLSKLPALSQIGCSAEIFELIKDSFDRPIHYNMAVNGRTGYEWVYWEGSLHRSSEWQEMLK